MKLLKLAVIVFFLTGCSAHSPVYSVGANAFTTTNTFRDMAIFDATQFCKTRNQHLHILRERQINDAYKSVVLDFQCLSPDNPLRNNPNYEVETLPDITIEKR